MVFLCRWKLAKGSLWEEDRLSKKPCRKFKNKKLHKAGKAPSGRELDFAKQKTEGECVNIKSEQNFKRRRLLPSRYACHLPPGGRLTKIRFLCKIPKPKFETDFIDKLSLPHWGRPRPSKKPCRKFKNKKLHKAGKAPSGRELDFAKQKTEGECVIQAFLIGFVCLQISNFAQTELFQNLMCTPGSFHRKRSPSLPREAFLHLIFWRN